MNLLFIYNAESGKINTLLDIAHKVVSPSTYKCDLCSLTHGALKERSEWAQFKTETTINLEFLHKDEFEEQYKLLYEYPVILDVTNDTKVALSKNDLSKIDDVTELIATVQKLSH